MKQIDKGITPEDSGGACPMPIILMSNVKARWQVMPR